MERDGPTLIRQLAARCRHTAKGELAEKTWTKVSLALLDYFSAVACGLQSPLTESLRKYADHRRGKAEAWCWVLKDYVSVETAAFANAALAHSAIRDDMHVQSNSHVGGITISACLALAQRDSWTGDQLLRALVAGYDAAAILGTAIQQSPGCNRHVRPSGLIGAFGVAAACIAATDPEGEDISVNALAFAANMASGLNQWAWSGTQEIFTEMGAASQQGIVAFDLARSGMACAEEVLEGRAGFFAAYGAGEKGVELFRQGLNRPVGSGIEDVRFKPIPGCNYIQTPASVALKLAREVENLSSRIASVSVGCTSGAKNYPGCDFAGPFATVLQTKMSIQFAVAAVLLSADTSEDVFNKTNDKVIEELAANCTVDALEEYNEPFSAGRQPARVEVTLKDGSAAKDELDDVPWLDADQVRARFQAEVTDGLLPDQPEKVQQLFAGLQDLAAVRDVGGEVMGLFRRTWTQSIIGG